MKRLALLCLFALACGSLYAGTTRKVPADHATIQDAVDNSVTGDIIAISKNTTTDGVYYETVTVPDTIDSLTFTGKVIWDGANAGGTGTCLEIVGPSPGPFLISGIIFRAGDEGVLAGSGGGGFEVDGVTVTGCQGQFLNNELANVRGTNFVATKNTLLGCNDGFAVTGNNATISGNKFTQCSGDGVNITGIGAVGTQIFLVEKNAFFLHDGGQLVTGTSSNATVISTSAKACVGGIQITGDNCKATSNSYSHVTGGIRLTDVTTGNNQALQNKFSITSGTALDVRGPNAVVSSNSISTCTGTAITTDDTSPDILSNSIKVADRGIQCSGTANDALIDKNKIATTFNNDGITVTGANLTITNNSINDVNNGDGIVAGNAGGGGALIDKNKLKNIGDNGIVSTCDGSSATVTISNCSVAYAGAGDQNGIDVSGNGTLVSKCKVSNIDGDGFNIDANNCEVSDCSATKCGIDGFDCDNTSDANTFLRCKASACSGEGFDNSDSTNTNVTDCSFTKNRINLASDDPGGSVASIVITNTTPSAVEGAPEVD